MPATNGLEILIRRDPISDEEWIELIKARISLLKPHLNSFTLQELGSVKCLMRETSGWQDTIGHATPTSGDNRFSLKTQGYFWIEDVSFNDDRPGRYIEHLHRFIWAPNNNRTGTVSICGLTRSSQLVVVKVSFVTEPGYKNRGLEVATKVEITETDLTSVAADVDRLYAIWLKLGGIVRTIAEHRKRLYSEVEDLLRIVEVEEFIAGELRGE